MAVKISAREFSLGAGARIPRTPGRRSRSWERGSADYLPSSSSWCASASGLYYSSSSSSVSNSQDKYQYTASGRWNNLDPTRRNKKSSIQYTKEFRQSQSDHTAALTDRTRWIQLIYEEALKMTIKLASVRDITGGVGISYKSSQILTPSVAICAGCGCGAEVTPSCGDNPDIMTLCHTSHVSGAEQETISIDSQQHGRGQRILLQTETSDIWIIFIRAMGNLGAGSSKQQCLIGLLMPIKIHASLIDVILTLMTGY